RRTCRKLKRAATTPRRCPLVLRKRPWKTTHVSGTGPSRAAVVVARLAGRVGGVPLGRLRPGLSGGPEEPAHAHLDAYGLVADACRGRHELVRVCPGCP